MGNDASWTNPGVTLAMVDADLELEATPGPPIILPVAPTIALDSFTSYTVVVDLSGGSNISSMTPQRRPAGGGAWHDYPTISPSTTTYTFSGLLANTAYDFRFAVTNPDGASFSNIVTQTTEEAPVTTNRAGLLYWMDADSLPPGERAGLNTAARPGWYGVGNTGTIIDDGNPYPGKTQSIWVDFPDNAEFQQGIFFESLEQFGPRPGKGDTIWFSLRMRPAPGFNWTVDGPVLLKFLHFRDNPPGDVGGGGVFTMLNGATGAVGMDNDEIGAGNMTQIPMYGGDARPPVGQWTTLEIAMVVDDVPLDSGGTGQFRFYLNGELAGKVTSQITMRYVEGIMYDVNEVRFISNWNHTPVGNMSAEFDDVCIAVKVAGQRDDSVHLVPDSEGFPHIGI